VDTHYNWAPAGADFSDFNSMPMFKHKDWYLNALKEKGLTHTTNWECFVENEIGDFKQWIMKNKPRRENI